MIAVSEAASSPYSVPQASRASASDRQDDFKAYLRQKTQAKDAAKAANASSSDEPAKDTSSSDEPTAADDTTTAAKKDDPQAQPDASLQWLAAQLLPIRGKEPAQGLKEGGPPQAPVAKGAVTLPTAGATTGQASAVQQQGAPVDPSTLPDVTASDVLTAGAPAVNKKLTDAATQIPVKAEAPAPAPVAVTEPIKTKPLDPSAAANTPPADPTVMVAKSEPTRVTTPQSVAPKPSADVQASDETQDDRRSTAVTPADGTSRAPVNTAHANGSTSGNLGSGLSGGSGDGLTKDSDAGDPPVPALQAGLQPGQATMAGVTQTHLAVPADHQLAPTLGLELASAAQGMSALDRMLQATDQSQTPAPMLKVLNLQLAPPDLGAVSVRMSLEGNAIDVHMSVDQGRTRTLIERDRHMIADSLTKVGYSVNTLMVEQSSATGESNLSSAGQSFSSTNGFDGSSGRQSNGAGGFGGSQGQSARDTGFMDNEAGAAPVPARPANGRGVFV